jgi:hypothetical protein
MSRVRETIEASVDDATDAPTEPEGLSGEARMALSHALGDLAEQATRATIEIACLMAQSHLPQAHRAHITTMVRQLYLDICDV